MAINFKKEHKSFSTEEITKICTGGKLQEFDTKPVDKTAFYKAPEGLVQFKTPTRNVAVRFDVLEFEYTHKYNKRLMDAGKFNAVGSYYWNYAAHVHECFPNTIVCNKNFEIKREFNDPICTYMWENKEVDFKRVNKTYVIMLLRVHPNEDLGISDYTYMYHIDTNGKLAGAIQKAWDKAVARKDNSKVNFFKWDDTGCSIEAYFSELNTPSGIKYWGSDDITFIPREKQLTEEDAEFLYSLDMCGGVQKPTEEEYEAFMERFKQKAPLKVGYVKEVATVAEPAPVAEITTNSLVNKQVDPTFQSPRELPEETDNEDWAN